MKLKPIAEQVVVVCGASSGMGRHAALEFARRGATVIVSSRNLEGLDALVSQMEGVESQHSTFNIQHSTFNIQHSTFNIQHSTFGIQHLAYRLRADEGA